MELQMAGGKVRLKGRQLLEKYGTTMYRLAKDGDLSYPTVHKYVTEPDSVQHMSMEVLYSILTGLGLSLDEIRVMTLDEVFEFVPNEDGEVA